MNRSRGLLPFLILTLAVLPAAARGPASATAALARVDGLIAAAQMPEAEAALRPLLADAPEDATLLLRQARIERYTGRLDLAENRLLGLLSQNRNLPEVRRDLAEVAFDRFDFGRAWSAFMSPYEHETPPDDVLVWVSAIDQLTDDLYGVSVTAASLELSEAYRPYATAFRLISAFERHEDSRARALAAGWTELPEHPQKAVIEQLAGGARQFYAEKHPTTWAQTGHPAPVFGVSWVEPERRAVRAVSYHARPLPDGARGPEMTLQAHTTGDYLRVSVEHYPRVSVVVHNTYYRHFGTDFTAPGKRPAGPLAVEVALQDDGTVRVAVDGHPLVGEGTLKLLNAGFTSGRLSFEIQSTTQDYPIENVFDHVALVDADGTRIPVRVQTVIPEVHTYRQSDDIREVNLRMLAFVPHGSRLPADWRQRLDYAAGQFQAMHFRMFRGRSRLNIEVVPTPVVGRFDYFHYANLRYGEMHDAIKKEVVAAVGYPDADYASLLVYADVRLEPYDPVANYGSGGVIWLHKGFSLVTREILSHSPRRPSVGADEKSNWMGYPDRKVHASWPWAVAYHEFLHGLGCPHTFKEPDSIMGGGLFLGTARAELPESISRYMFGVNVPDKDAAKVAREKRQAGDNAGAVEYYERALRASPDDAGLKYELATCLDACGRYHRALALVEPLMEAAPDEPIYAWFVGTEHYQLGEVDAAISVFQGLLKKHPDYPYAHSSLSQIYTDAAGHRDREKALRHAERALELYRDAGDKKLAREHL